MWNQTPVSTGDNWEMIPDGEGGVIIAWDNFSLSPKRCMTITYVFKRYPPMALCFGEIPD